jgi:hypothetical protein
MAAITIIMASGATTQPSLMSSAAVTEVTARSALIYAITGITAITVATAEPARRALRPAAAVTAVNAVTMQGDNRAAEGPRVHTRAGGQATNWTLRFCGSSSDKLETASNGLGLVRATVAPYSDQN